MTKTKTKKTPTKRKAISASLRYDILVKFKFRCNACGVSAKEARLEIDHVIPVALGGLSIAKNLQVLCRSCNRGKSAKYKKSRKCSKL